MVFPDQENARIWVAHMKNAKFMNWGSLHEK